MIKGTFPNEEKNQWVEKCPQCGEEFLKYKGGPQCQLGKCSDLDLQNKHEEVLPLMVACALPQYRIETSVPKDWNAFGAGMYDGSMGLSNPFASPPWLKIPWYTCRIKGTFFDTTCHELGHISAIHAETSKGHIWFNSSTRRAIRKYNKIFGKSKLREKFEQNPKYKSKVKYFWEQQNKTNKDLFPYPERGHEKTAWQNEYIRIHGTLMGSQFAWYNYQKTKPKNYPLSVFWKDF